MEKKDKSAKLAEKFYKNLGPEGMASLTSLKRDSAILRFITYFLEKEDRILDLCCGYGRVTIPLAKKGYNIEGIDLSLSLIKEAKKHAKKEKMDVSFKIGDMRSLPYEKKDFNKILCLWSSFNHLLTKKGQLKALNEIFRILKKEGVAILELPNGESTWAKKNIKKYGRRIPSQVNNIEVTNYIHDRKTLKNLCKKSHFRKYEIKFSNIGGRKRLILILEK